MRDLRYALRFLASRWGVTSVAVFVMSLGISLTATMYAIIDGVILSGPDYPELEEILYLRTTLPQSQFDQALRMICRDSLNMRKFCAGLRVSAVLLSCNASRP